MKKFMCIVLAFVLVVLCGCSVARLYFDIAATAKEAVPVYTYSHWATGALILATNSRTGEVKFVPVCPRCGMCNTSEFSSDELYISEGAIETAVVTSNPYLSSSGEYCSNCDIRWNCVISVTVHVDYQ